MENRNKRSSAIGQRWKLFISGQARESFSGAFEKKKDENYFNGTLLDSIFQGESQLLVIELETAGAEAQELRVRIPNQSVTDKALPAIGEKVTIALKVADSYVVS